MEKDLLVIGGGINGLGIAADASGRGLSVVLCEMGDLASATSSSSSRLIHGGLRYLENLEFKLVHESLQERSILLRLAPHLVRLQPFVFPQSPWSKPFWMVRLGIKFYDLLAHDKLIPSAHTLTGAELSNLELKQQYTKALQYYDCTEDDSRLAVSVALLARQHGAQILTHTRVIQAIRKEDGWLVTIAQNNDMQVLKVKAIVNAAGPWVQQVASDVLGINTKHQIKLVKGSHIIVPKLFTHNKAFILQNKDGRVVFLIPYLNDFTLIGTTEVVLDYIEHPVTVSPGEIEYLCAITNQFVQRPISPGDIINQYAGIRPLQDDSRQQARKITRDYVIEIDNDNLQAPAISIFGGKITTYRHLSENVGNMLGKFFPDCGPAWTKTAHLPGGDFINNNIDGFKSYLISVFPTLPPAVLNHYVDNYGMRAGEVLDKVHTIKDLGRHFGALLYQREVDYLVDQEWATCAEDILWRRGKMGLWFNAEQTKNLDDYLTKRHHTK